MMLDSAFCFKDMQLKVFLDQSLSAQLVVHLRSFFLVVFHMVLFKLHHIIHSDSIERF